MSSARTNTLGLILLALCYAVPVIASWNMGYLDFGDGNYMYISWRLSQGAVLYRDILAPQPPLHLYVGAAVAWLGDKLLPHPIWAFRVFSLLLHLGTMLLVWSTARLVWSRESARSGDLLPLAAAAIYLFLPIGFWWTLGYQSQPLLIFLLLIMFYGVIRSAGVGRTFRSVPNASSNQSKWILMSGAAGGLALLTNMTTAPYVLFTAGWLLLRCWRHGLIFTAVAAAFPAVVIPLMEVYTGAYISNVVQNQVGAFPRADVLAQSGQTVAGYIINKLQTEGGDVLRLEGTWVALGVLGMLFFGLKRRAANREYILFFSFFSLCSIIYVAKGGTVDYVFSLAEPYVAIFAALPLTVAVGLAARFWKHSLRKSTANSFISDFTPLLGAVLLATFLLSACWTGLVHNILTLHQRTYELNEAETLRIVSQIKQRSKPNDLIIAPPHLAFLAERRIVEDYSEHFLWRLKYMNERLDGEQGRAVSTIQAMAAALSKKELPFLVLDMNQTGIIPEIQAAVEANYRPLLAEPMKTLNTPLQFYVPK